MLSRRILFFGLLVVLAIVLAGCAGAAGETGPAGPAGPAGPGGPAGAAGSAGAAGTMVDLTCGECHDESGTVTAKQTAWSESLHGTGDAYGRGSSTSCVGCHSGNGFSEMVAAGLTPDTMEAGDPDPTRQDCRTCHAIHTTFTGEDWALETTAPVAMYAFEGETFDGGKGNLCANCHQGRRGIAEAVDGIIEVTSTHWGPHHGPQSTMLLGLGGGGLEGSPSAHYAMVEDTCVTCHLGEGDDHTFEPDEAACTACHAELEDFDYNGVQTEVQAMLDELEELLVAAELLDEEGHPAVAEMPEAEAYALWNWIYIAHEDKSLGVHNSKYTIALLEASLEAMGAE